MEIFIENYSKVFFSLFNCYIPIIDESEERGCVENSGTALNNLPQETVSSLCNSTIKYCHAIEKALNKPLSKFNDSSDILKMLSPSALIVPWPENENDTLISIEFNCEFEEEHGLQWLLLNSRLTYVGPFQGISPYEGLAQSAEVNFV